MNSKWMPTNDYYHEIIAADDATRQRLYRQYLIEPWKAVMAMVGGMFPGAGDDDLAGARAWAWLLPEDLKTVPPLLETLENANAWRVGAEALAEGVAHFGSYADQVPFDSVEGWLVLADASRSDPVMQGYTGAIDWTQPRIVLQYDTVTEANLRSLPGAAVHELNHLVRLSAFPWNVAQTSVADYIIHEGLAESFARALFGDDVLGYYVTEFDGSQLDAAKAIIREGLNQTGFDVIRSYIFGDHWAEKLGLPLMGVPTYGGYAIGYRVVQAYLERTGQSIEAATFTPAQEIIAQSGYFDDLR